VNQAHPSVSALIACALLISSCTTPKAGEDQETPAAPGLGESRPEQANKESRLFRDILANTGKLSGGPVSGSGDPAGVVSLIPEPLEEEDGDFVVAPIPFLNPTIGAGLALGVAYLTPLSEGSPPSLIGGGAFYSDNSTRGISAMFKGYFDEDRYRLALGVAKMRINYELTVDGYGEVPIQQDVALFGAEFLARIVERIFIGPQVLVSGLDTSIRQEDQEDAIDDEDLKADSISLGLRVLRDTRDSTFYPRTGSTADLQVRAYDESLGSEFTYQIVPVSYNAYFSPGERDVVAVRASGRFASGDVPFYAESFFGSQSDLRGYTVGTIHDKTLLAVQAEYRRELFWRFGGVVFGGVGTVAPSLSDLDDADVLPSGGFGLRITLEEENHVNFRLDFAFGDGQSAIYFGVGEAF
jgi:hypothetical protein